MALWLPLLMMDHLCSSLQVLRGAGAAPRLDAHVVFCSHSSDRDRHSLPAARPKGDDAPETHNAMSEEFLFFQSYFCINRQISLFFCIHNFYDSNNK